MSKTKKSQGHIFLLLTLSAVILLLLLYIKGFPLQYAVLDASISLGLFLFTAHIIFLIQTHFHAEEAIHVSHIGLIVVATVFYQLTFNTLIQVSIGYQQWHELVRSYEAPRAVIVLLLHILIVGFWWNFKKEENQQKILKQLVDQERALIKAELDNLHQQIQPHFLFNSLNSIGALTELNPKEANRMIHLLSDFLRGSLRRDLQITVPLEEEIEQAKRYLEIEKIRFSHRLNVEFDIDESCVQAMLPPLIIQPVLENAIKFGLYSSSESVLIQLSFLCVNNFLTIQITNPFDPNWVDDRKGKGFGLTSIRKRLSLLYNQHDLLQTQFENHIFKTQIRIPQ